MTPTELASIVSAGLTAALVLITGFYAWATYGILRANEKLVRAVRDQIEEAMRPYVTISVFGPPKSIILYLRIANTGRSPAYNVRLEIDRDFYKYGSNQSADNLRALNAFTQEIQCFPAGAELVFALAQGFKLFGPEANAERTPLVFNVTVTYSYPGQTRRETTTIDLNPYLSSHATPDPTLDELEHMRKEIEKIASALDKRG